MKCSVILLVALSMTSVATANLIISEYVEGTSNNKAIELFNTGTGDIDLSLVSLSFYFNGSGSAGTTIDGSDGLSGTLVPGEVFVIADDGWALGGTIDFSDSSGFFNGDDAVELSFDGSVVDVIGQVGFDPGSQWGSGSQSTQNNTLTRNIDILVGDSDGSDAFDPSLEWRGGSQNTHTLGTHDGNFSIAAVPEPTAILFGSLLAAGLGLTVGRRPQIGD